MGSQMLSPAEAASPAKTDRRVEVTEEGVQVEWSIPGFEMREAEDGVVVPYIPGYDLASNPGMPQIPTTAALIALPPGAEPSLEVLHIDETESHLTGPLAVNGQPGGVLRTDQGQVTGGAFVAASQRADAPSNPLELEILGVVRGVRLARLTFYPLRPQGQSLRLTRSLRVLVRFNSPSTKILPIEFHDDPIISTLREAVINPEHIQLAFSSLSPQSLVQTETQEQPRVAIEVEETGLTELTYQALSGTGYPVDQVNPQQLHLKQGTAPIAYEWDGDSDSAFEPGERLLFFAQPRFSRWTGSDVYTLGHAATPGLRMESRSADPAGLPAAQPRIETLIEQNTIYTPDCYCAPVPPGRDGDRWVWDDLKIPTHPIGDYEFHLLEIEPMLEASLIVWLIGYTDLAVQPDHQVKIALNGVSLGIVEWDGKQAIQKEFQVSPGTLHAGENTLSLSLPGLTDVAVEGTWIDAFSLRFASTGTSSGQNLLFSGEDSQHSYSIKLASMEGLRAYDVSNPADPLRLSELDTSIPDTVQLGDSSTNGIQGYWVTSETGILSPLSLRLTSPLTVGGKSAGAEYVIVTPKTFIPAMGDLVKLRKGQGYNVLVEDVQAIYDIFGDGRPDPAAIRAYLANGYMNWAIRPLYVLLAGDGTSDPRHYNPTSSDTYIPPYLEDVDPWAGETAADNRYVTVDGSDNLPDLLIGRLPGNDPAEIHTMVSKIVQYSTVSVPLHWNALSAYIADDPDGAGNFPMLAEAVIHQAPLLPLAPRRLYFDPLEMSPEQFRATLQSTWDRGQALMLYAGHASIHQWAVERFIHLEDVGQLANGERLPVLLEMTCFTASFQVPAYPTLDESLLRHPSGGVIAAWGSTGLGISTGHKQLAQGFAVEVFQDGANLGSATLAGKFRLLEGQPYYLDLIDTFTLLGDPAMNLTHSEYAFIPLNQH
jgi:hypothetical protein